MGPEEGSLRKRSLLTPALLIRMSIVRVPVVGEVKWVLAAEMMVLMAGVGSERSACTGMQVMLCVVERVLQRDSVRARELSEV